MTGPTLELSSFKKIENCLKNILDCWYPAQKKKNYRTDKNY